MQIMLFVFCEKKKKKKNFFLFCNGQFAPPFSIEPGQTTLGLLRKRKKRLWIIHSSIAAAAAAI